MGRDVKGQLSLSLELLCMRTKKRRRRSTTLFFLWPTRLDRSSTTDWCNCVTGSSSKVTDRPSGPLLVVLITYVRSHARVDQHCALLDPTGYSPIQPSFSYTDSLCRAVSSIKTTTTLRSSNATFVSSIGTMRANEQLGSTHRCIRTMCEKSREIESVQL